MSALSEQLVQDYLSRLYAAGRGRLTRADRRALVERTSEFIQQGTGPVGTVSALDVAKLLSGLGDPAAIVDAEEARLAGMRGEADTGLAERPRGLGRLLVRAPGQARRRWPVQPAGKPELTESLMAVTDDDEGVPDGPVLTGRIILPGGKPRRWGRPDEQLSPDEFSEVVPDDPAADNEHGGHEPRPSAFAELGLRPSWPSVVARDASWLDSAPDVVRSPEQEGQDSEWLDDEWADEEPDEEDLDRESPDDEAADEAAGEDALDAGLLHARTAVARWPRLVARHASLLAVWVADRFRKQPVESLAATLLGIGGAAFPPVWLLGAALALASRIWDYRDKLAGLALPVLATLVGTIAGICLAGGASLAQYLHNGWLFADVLSRIAAVVGAAFLAWRAAHGKRPPAVPPWAKAHKVG